MDLYDILWFRQCAPASLPALTFFLAAIHLTGSANDLFALISPKSAPLKRRFSRAPNAVRQPSCVRSLRRCVTRGWWRFRSLAMAWAVGVACCGRSVILKSRLK